MECALPYRLQNKPVMPNLDWNHRQGMIGRVRNCPTGRIVALEHKDVLKHLSPTERDTLVQLRNNGPGSDLDHMALNELFKLRLVEVDAERRVVLTAEGRELAKQSTPHA
jgi:hypothetical protein